MSDRREAVPLLLPATPFVLLSGRSKGHWNDYRRSTSD